MATRSTIAVMHEDGTISQVYCHYDGYVQGVGKTLVEHYNTSELAEKLVSHGSISALYKRIDPTGTHSFTEREAGTTLFYTPLRILLFSFLRR